MQAGGLVTRLEATDADSGPNSALVYEIVSGNDDSAFHVDASTGVVTVAAGGALARRASTLHRLVVAVRDGGTRPFKTVADLVVAVNDSAVVATRLAAGGAGGAGPRGGGGLEVTVALAGGAAVGVALVVGCLLLVAVVLCCLRRRRKKRKRCREELEQQRRLSKYEARFP